LCCGLVAAVFRDVLSSAHTQKDRPTPPHFTPPHTNSPNHTPTPTHPTPPHLTPPHPTSPHPHHTPTRPTIPPPQLTPPHLTPPQPHRTLHYATVTTRTGGMTQATSLKMEPLVLFRTSVLIKRWPRGRTLLPPWGCDALFSESCTL
jgi:hypothetical protein